MLRLAHRPLQVVHASLHLRVGANSSPIKTIALYFTYRLVLIDTFVIAKTVPLMQFALHVGLV